MKYRVLVTTLVLALATLGSVAVADTTQPTQIVTGKVISSTPTQLVVEADNGARTTFVVDKATMPSTIMVGDKVSVNYQSQAGGSFRATNVSATTLSNTGTGMSDATGVNTNDSSTNDASSMATVPPTYNNTTGSTATDSTMYSNEATTRSSTSYSTDSSALPATASNQPLILLLGLLALGGFLLRTVTRS